MKLLNNIAIGGKCKSALKYENNPLGGSMFKKSILLSTSLILSGAMAIPANAQFDDEIIVTATKRETTLQDTPVAVTVTSGEALEKAEILDIKDLQSLVPTFRVSQLQNSANTSLSIRGFANGTNNIGLEPSVALFIDGVYRSRAAAQIADLPKLDRVEVLSGPQSTLFGKNAAAGVVSIVTAKPSYETEGYIEVGAGNFNLFKGKGYFSTGLGENLAFSLGGGFQQRDGYGEIVNLNEEINNLDRLNARAQLLFEPNDATSFRLIGDISSFEEECCIVASPLQQLQLPSGNAFILTNFLGAQLADPNDAFSFETFLNQNTTNTNDDIGVSLQGDFDLGFATLTSISSLRNNENGFETSDSDFTTFDLLGNVFNDVNIDTFTQEFRLTSNPGDRNFDWMIGGFYYDEGIEQNSGATFGTQARLYLDTLFALGGDDPQGDLAAVLAGTASPLGDIEALFPALTVGESFGNGVGSTESFAQDNESFSLFGTLDFHVTDRLTLSGGLNYTEDRKELTAIVVNDDAFANVNFVGPEAVGAITSATIAGFAPNVAAICGAAPSADLTDNLVAVGTAPGCNTSLLAPAGFPDLGVVPGSVLFDLATGGGVLPTFAGGVAAATPLNVACAPGQNPPFCNPFANPLLIGAQFFLPFTNLPNAVEDGRTNDDQITWNIRAAYEVNDNLNVYASAATGFKASSWNLTRNSLPFPADLALLQQQGLATNNPVSGTRFAGPEETTVFEIGLKSRFENGALNIAAFDQTIEGFQSTLFVGSAFVLNNAGEQSVRGFEWDGTYSPIETLNLRFAGTYLDAEYDDFTGAQGVDGAIDLTGERPAGIPEWALSLGANYEFYSSEALTAYIQGDFDFQSATTIVDNLPVDLTRKVGTLNASLGLDFENGVDLRIWGRNINNDEYFTSGFPGPAQTLPPPASVNGTFNTYPNQPRTYGVTLRYNFGGN